METTQRQPVTTSVTIDADLYELGQRAVAAGRAESLDSWANDAFLRQAEQDLDEQNHRIASSGFDEPEEAEAYFRMRRAHQRADTEYLMSRVRRRLAKLWGGGNILKMT